jgi:flagellar assembly factor FliW
MTSAATTEQADMSEVTHGFGGTSRVAGEVRVASKVLGDISVPTDQVYTFDLGIFGFPGANSWVLMPAERDGFFWIQSVDFEALTYLVIDPFQYVDGYSVELTPRAITELAPDDAGDVLVLAILTLPRDEDELPTANLQGPLALNVVAKRGIQAVVESQFGLRHPVVI